METRPNFLILPFVLVFLSASIARYYGYVNLTSTVLSLIGLLLLHISTNVLNEYYDYKSGIDFDTEKTPFSGGSGILISEQLPAKVSLLMGITSFILAIPIGIYFVLTIGLKILPIFLIGSIFVLFYTSHLAKIGYGISEISAGLGLGTLPIIGTYVIISEFYSFSAIYASIPSGILVANLLFLNEFPDTEADRKGGRKTLPVVFGKDKSAILYSILTSFVYIWIIVGISFRIIPVHTIVALLTLPFSIKSIKGAFAHKQKERFLSAQGTNVLVVLITQFLLGVGFVFAKIF